MWILVIIHNYFLAYIPRFEDIEKTEQNLLIETTFGKILGEINQEKGKVYKHEYSQFVRCHNLLDNQESIHRFRNNLVQPGICRYLFSNGITCIGNRCFPREGGIDQLYRLFRLPSGNIYYDHQIHRNSKWDTITVFKFDHTNLSWKQTI